MTRTQPVPMKHLVATQRAARRQTPRAVSRSNLSDRRCLLGPGLDVSLDTYDSSGAPLFLLSQFERSTIWGVLAHSPDHLLPSGERQRKSPGARLLATRLDLQPRARNRRRVCGQLRDELHCQAPKLRAAEFPTSPVATTTTIESSRPTLIHLDDGLGRSCNYPTRQTACAI